MTPPPACAGTLVADANDLAYGTGALADVDRRVLRDQLKCQKRIGKAVSYYVGIKLRYLIKRQDGGRGGSAKRPSISTSSPTTAPSPSRRTPAAASCCRPSARSAPPQFQRPAARSIAAKLRDCLRQLGEVWVDRWGPDPQPLRPNILFILSDDQRWDTTDETHSPVPGAGRSCPACAASSAAPASSSSTPS